MQFGGASGTLAALGDKGIDVGRAMAKELGLGFPDAPWHAHRDRLAALVAACGVLTGTLGKMARDISLLMQGEVGEAAEPGGEGRGGSSTMPQKRNPIASACDAGGGESRPGTGGRVSLGHGAGARARRGRMAGGVADGGGRDPVDGAGDCVDGGSSQGLEVDAEQMRANIEATGGSVFAEKAALLLAAKLGREEARKIVAEAARRSEDEGRTLKEVLGEIPEVTRALGSRALRDLETPEKYLGVAEELRKRLLMSEGREDSKPRKR